MKKKGHYQKKTRSRKDAKTPRNDRDFIREHGKLQHNRTYGVDRKDCGTGGGVQTPRHDADNQCHDWRDHEGEY